MAGVYIHIPFCRRKCYYCDFFSVGSKRAPWKRYAQALSDEAAARASEWVRIADRGLQTLYIGGGTPSQMPTELLCGVIEGVQAAMPGFVPQEITVEVNPEDVTPVMADALAGCGVNRVSMGVQTLSDRELQAIGRTHTAGQALRAYEVLRTKFAEISLDLMFGLPGQSAESWRRSVEGLLALRPEHLSAYSLMWEERTALSKMRAIGKVQECDEDLSERMFTALAELTAAAGYSHYEISNYCLPGHRSRHNSQYWAGKPYLGLGPGAHSYDGERIRRANLPETEAYMARYADGVKDIEVYETECLTDEELNEEYIMTRLRTCEGIDIEDYRHRFGDKAAKTLLHRAMRSPRLLATSPLRISLHPEGVMLSDQAILSLI